MWRNWAGDEACHPATIEHPASATEVVLGLERAVAGGRGVRVAGRGHSFTPAALTGGSLLLLDRMTGLVDADGASGLARVRAGTSIRALNAALPAYGLALENLGDVDVQTLAGAVATATHGTGAALRNLSAQVVALELVRGLRGADAEVG